MVKLWLEPKLLLHPCEATGDVVSVPPFPVGVRNSGPVRCCSASFDTISRATALKWITRFFLSPCSLSGNTDEAAPPMRVAPLGVDPLLNVIRLLLRDRDFGVDSVEFREPLSVPLVGALLPVLLAPAEEGVEQFGERT